MGTINYGRVIIGGLLAGVVITIGESILNLVVVADQWQAFMEAHNLPGESTSMNIMWLLWNFILGITLVLVYALIRPRCGAGPKTAAQTGFLVWFLVWFLCFGAIGLAFGMQPGLILTSLLFGLVEVIVAALVGGWAYREGAAEGAAA